MSGNLLAGESANASDGEKSAPRTNKSSAMVEIRTSMDLWKMDKEDIVCLIILLKFLSCVKKEV